MRSIFTFLMVGVVSTTLAADVADGGKKAVGKIGKSITKEVAAIKQPIDEAITYIGSSQCANVKKILGVSYEQLEGAKEPDLNSLTLKFISSAVTITYNITQAAQLIPETREYNPRQRLVIFIHGFTDDPTKASFSNISDSFFATGNYNVLALDGSSLIHWLYLRSTSYVRFMGEKLGEVLASMVHSGVDPASVYVIGHSLGAHISGFTGKTFTNLTGLQLGRITGLDPAGPCFSQVDEDLRLKDTDAAFVDVIHTDAGVYGLKDAVGHVDFYPNSGSEQPNCLFQTCSHSRAWLYYAETVTNPESFPAIKCKDWEAFEKGECDNNDVRYMGYPADRSSRGLYFLQTGEEAPYGLGKAGLVYKNNDAIIKNLAKTADATGDKIASIGKTLFG